MKRIKQKIKQWLFKGLKLIHNPFASKKLLIVRLDAIGDYVLFRNSIKELKQSRQFNQYRFFLLGNKSFKDLAEAFDKEYIEGFFWVHPSVVYNVSSLNISTFLLLVKLKLKGFHIVINPVHSRVLSVDLFIRNLNCRHNVASTGDDINYHGSEKITGDQVYEQLIPVPGYNTFEFYRNQVFVKNLLQDTSIQIPLQLPVNREKTSSRHQTVVLFPGAGHAGRRWSAANFALLAGLIHNERKNVKFMVAGSSSDKPFAKDIISRCGSAVFVEDLTGTTNLPDFAELLASADLLIANETSAIHIAASVNLPAICISNANHFGRFNPYPADLKPNIITVYPEMFINKEELFLKHVEVNKIKSVIDINLITPQMVFNAAERFLVS